MPRRLEDYLNQDWNLPEHGPAPAQGPSVPQQPTASAGPVASAPAPGTQQPKIQLPSSMAGLANNPDYDFVPNYGYRLKTGHTPSVPVPSGAGTGGAGTSSQYAGKSATAIMQSFFGTLPPTSQSLDQVIAALNSAGHKASRATHGVGGSLPSDDKIVVDGQMFDLIKDVGGPGAAWMLQPAGMGVPGGGEFDDPWGSTLESAVTARINQLLSPENRQGFNDYISELLGNASRSKQRASDFATAMRKRQAELREYPYTAGDEAIMRAKAFDSLERRRSQTMKNQLEQSYANGFAPTSGTNQQVAEEVNRQFEGQRTSIESNLLQSAIAESNQRKNEATQLEGIIADALNGGDLQALQDMAARSSAETENLNRNDARQREILATIGLPIELMNSRTASANAVLNGGSSAQSAMDTILRLFGVGNQTNQVNAQYNANNQAGLGQLLAILFPPKQQARGTGTDNV